MQYTTLSSLKTKLGVTADGSDSELSLIIEKATGLIDLKIGYNLGLQDVEKRIDGTGECHIYLDRRVNSIEYIRSKDGFTEYDIDYIDGYMVYLNSKAPKGRKNIEIKYNIGFSTVPVDIEEICLNLSVALALDYGISGSNSESLKETNIKTQKLGSLSITYFSDNERKKGVKDTFSLNETLHIESVIGKYRAFR